MKAFYDIFEDDSRNGTKLKTDEYCVTGKNCIIDQGKELVAGYTDREEGLYIDVPAIIFGDHTRIIKYIDKPFFLGADGVKILKSKVDNSNYKYLYYALKNAKIPDTGYNRHFKWLKEVQIKYPNSDIQADIVRILDKVSEIISKRHRQLNELDMLVKARFVEMFGDPQLNPKGWKVVNISEVVGGKVSNGFFAKRDDYVNDGNVSVLGVANIVNRMYSKIDELPRTNADDNEIKKYEVKYGDMLFCRSSLVAEGIGKASIIPENVQKNILFECHVIRLQLDLNKCVPEFMQTLSTMDSFRNQVIAQSKTATMTTIGQDGILKTDIILPPLESQRKFYNFIKQVNKSKSAIKKSLEETQILFDSLMQKYFG
ncbi:MAG: restriction endonuclease subunit S [Selenomonadaceae bacterium]|nr:restriction endonuclease subunit S [Selenomonadaceae bacterium]